MRRAVGAALCLCLLLSGCASREPDELTVVRLLSADGTAERVTVTAFPAPTGEEEQAADPTAGQGGTVAEACMDLTAQGSSFSFLGHGEHLAVGETYAAGGLEDLLRSAVLGDDLRPDTCLWVVRGGRGDDWCRQAGGDDAVVLLDAWGRENGHQRRWMERTAAQTWNSLLSHGAAAVPALSGEAGEEGYAILTRDGLAGYAEGDAKAGLELLMGQACHNAASAWGETLWVSGVTTGVTPRLESGVFQGITVTCRAAARRTNGGAVGEDALASARNALEQQLERQLRAALSVLKEMDADPTGLGSRAAAAAPFHSKAVEEGWPEELAELDVTISVHVKVDR